MLSCWFVNLSLRGSLSENYSLWFSVLPLRLGGEPFSSNFTTETQRFTEFAQRKAFSDRLLRGLDQSSCIRFRGLTPRALCCRALRALFEIRLDFVWVMVLQDSSGSPPMPAI